MPVTLRKSLVRYFGSIGTQRLANPSMHQWAPKAVRTECSTSDIGGCRPRRPSQLKPVSVTQRESLVHFPVGRILKLVEPSTYQQVSLGHDHGFGQTTQVNSDSRRLLRLSSNATRLVRRHGLDGDPFIGEFAANGMQGFWPGRFGACGQKRTSTSRRPSLNP
jgi:hypothetical protein